MPKQLHQVSCSSNHYWGRPSCFPRNCLYLWSSLRTGRIRVHGGCPDGAEEITCNDLLGGCVLGGRRFDLHCRFLRSSGGIAGVVALSSPHFLETFLLGWLIPYGNFVTYYGLLMCSPTIRLVTVYVPYRTLKRGFPVRALQ
jgi:hypothetical protein